MTIIWSVTNKDGSSFPLAGKEVHLYYTCERGRFEADIQIQDNVVAWDFAGRDQRVLGGYTLTLEVIQPGGKRIIRKDICNAFTLVGKGCEENDTPGDADINEGGEITLVSELDIYRISPIIPYVGEDDYWWVDDQKTPWYSRGPKGEVTDVAYLDFEIDDEMNLNLTFISGNEDMNLKFTLGEDGQLTLDN